MSAAGFASLPVIPVFQGISKDLERQLAGPLSKASKAAGESLEKGVGQGADNAAKAVEKAQYRVLKSTQELEAAESKLTEQKLKSEAASKAVEAAARKRAEAEGKGAEAVEKAEQDLLRKRAAAERASRDLASAEQGVERAMAESANAAKSLEDRQKALADAQDEAADSAKRSMSTMDKFKASAEGVGSGLMRAAEGMKVHATVALGAIGGLLASSTAYAAEAEQSYGAVESIFAGHADVIVAKSKEAATAVGLSGREYRELSSVTGAMLKNMGLPMDEVTAKTQDLVGVAADLSATFGGSTKDAIEAVNALLRGEADPIERYGVSIKKTDVNARLAAEGLDKLEGEALKQAEAQTLLAMLMEQTADAQGQFARETDTAAHKQQVATARMNDAREAIGTSLLPVMASLAEFGAKVAEKIGEHPRIFLAVAGAVAVLSAGLVGLAVVAPIFTAISVAAGAAGMSMWGYVAAQAAAIAPIAAVVAGVAALAAGLTWFFTQTELGRQAWQALVDAFTVGWNWLRDAVFTPMWAFVSAVLLPGLVAAWDGIRVGFSALAAAVQWAWANILQPVLSALGALVVWLWQNIASPMFGLIGASFRALADGIAWAWGNIIRPAWDAMGAALTWLWGNVFSPVLGWIVDRWNWMGALLDQGRVFIVDTVFGGLGRGLDTVRGWFQTAVDAITRIWDGIKAAAARPVRFVVDTVFNNGIRPAWNAVAKFTGLDELQPVGLGDLGNYAHGGILPGYTPGRDPYMFVEPRTGMRIGLSGGEAIMRPEVTRALGVDNVDGLNAAARMGGVSAVQRYLGGFASGGVIGSISDAVRKFFPMMTITSTLRPGDPGWHGQGKAVDFSNGTDSTPQMRSAAEWFYANYGPGLLELIHSPFNNNVKNGQNVGNGFGFYGAGTMNGHRNHVHVAAPGPLGDPSVMVEMLEDAGSGSGFSVFSMVKSLWDKAIEKIGSWSGPGLIGQLPGAMLSKLVDAAWNTIKEAAEKVAAKFGGAGGSAGNAESWREMAMWAMRREGFNADDPAQVNAMLAQIMSESGGNPGIAQQIVDVNGTGESAGVGLLQIIPGTFATYRDPSLPDDRRDPEANMVAALRYYKARYGTDLTTMWGNGHGYAKGGVLPGFTPGRDVHKFFSPTGGALALSGGESIMVPEWTRAVGGPAAVAAMNRAASGGRAGGSAGAFAGGGVWGGVTSQYDDLVRQFQNAVNQFQEAAARISDASSYEGLAARAGLSKFGEFASALGFDGTSKIISATLGAEKELLDAREQHATRMKDLAAKESALESARKALSDAESASYDDEEKRKDAIAKATEDASKAEDDLTEARKKSASALDMRIFDVAPQIHGMLSQAAAATTAIPALSGALGGLAVAAGPAGISVGVAIQAVMTGINLFKTVMGAISELVSGVFDARAKMFALHAQALQAQYEWAKTVDDMRAKVVELRVSWVEAQVALRDATWKTRLAQADVVRAQLQGVKTVAEAEAKLEAERKRVARAAARDLNDMSLLYDRYRWLEYQGLADRLDLAVTVTPEILALEAEVNAAKLTALANQRSASLAALQASWEQQKAALNLQQVQANLAMQTQQLALMQAQFGGFGQAESLQAMNTAKLYEERAKVQSQIGKAFWRPSYWLTGAGSADRKRIAELDRLIAEREAEGKGAGAPVKGTGWMSFFGYGDSASNAVKNGGYGSAEEAMWKFQEAQQLQQIELQKKQLEQQIEQNKLFVEYQKQIGDLQAEIEALKAGAASAQYTADAYREDNPAVKAALEALARFEAERSAEYSAVSSGRKQVVEITIPAQDTYTREQVDALLRAVQQVQAIDARVTVLETPEKPGASRVLQDITRGY
ncbi:transglycosylase SLT domain-containing protein [uncultured Corynebacterium sp.]|uniref:transglycosylase SLT domain-containing protein n=1 Tax=uncultured Corynebacterium sp. TaxID=159447 RepID=UPI0025999107|nr:transglycosylase SLT domain-containing protein [uncultured Corynebacterium sp.]